MPTSRNDTRVLCPFYKCDESLKDVGIMNIVCEGLVEGNSVVLRYKKKRDFMIQLNTFCCAYFFRCEIYRMLMAAKYSDEQGTEPTCENCKFYRMLIQKYEE